MTKTAMTAIEWQYKIARALHQQRLQTPDILQTALSMTCEALTAPYGCIATFDADGLRHAYLFGTEVDADSARELWNRLITGGIIGLARSARTTFVVDNIATDARWPQLGEHNAMPRKGSAVAIPMVHDGNLYGVISLIDIKQNSFDQRTRNFITSVAEVTAAALANSSLLETELTREAGYRRLAERAQNERAERARFEQLRHDLSSMTYHDLRGLVQNIQTSLTGIERLLMMGNTDRVPDLMSIAQLSTRQVARMVKGLLDIERLEQGKPILNRQMTAISSLIDESVELLVPLAAESDQLLGGECDVSRMIDVDGDMILRVIMNLVENAIKHTPQGGQIRVRATTEHEAVVIRVTDTGPGIPPEFRDEIFDKFFRIKHVDAPNGIGLGLAFCRLAVEAHNGRIWVEDGDGAGDQIGATFAFTIPFEVQTAALHDPDEDTQGD